MREKRIHLLAAHLPGMAQLVKSQESAQPMLVGVNRAAGIVAGLQFLLVALDEARRAGAGRRSLAFGHGVLVGSASSAFPSDPNPEIGQL